MEEKTKEEQKAKKYIFHDTIISWACIIWAIVSIILMLYFSGLNQVIFTIMTLGQLFLILGIIATKDITHIALFFVDGKYHRSGVGRQLWRTVLADNNCNEITVNSSIYAQEVYKHFGFEQADTIQESDGIKYIPMKYKMFIKEDCPCRKVKCFRHGHCNECRAHHETSKKLRPCER